jgi:hypothetical protein
MTFESFKSNDQYRRKPIFGWSKEAVKAGRTEINVWDAGVLKWGSERREKGIEREGATSKTLET